MPRLFSLQKSTTTAGLGVAAIVGILTIQALPTPSQHVEYAAQFAQTRSAQAEKTTPLKETTL